MRFSVLKLNRLFVGDCSLAYRGDIFSDDKFICWLGLFLRINHAMEEQMKIINYAYGVAIAISLAVVNVSASDETTDHDAMDAGQETKISTAYVFSTYLNAYELNVPVKAVKATFIDSVEGAIYKDLAVELAHEIQSISDINTNKLAF